VLLAPCAAAALATHADAELIALARRVKDLIAESDRAWDACETLEDAFVPPPVPEPLIVTPRDARDFTLKTEADERFRPDDVASICAFRDAILDLASLTLSRGLGPRPGTREMIARACEIEAAYKAYTEELRTAQEAFGLPAAQARAERLSAEVGKALQALAFMPAQTVEGVLAKVEAVSARCVRVQLDDPPRKDSLEMVLETAAIELADLRKTWEA
jgi:hypothetical protein